MATEQDRHDSGWVTLRIGETLFSTTLDTLSLHDPNSFFGKLFSPNWRDGDNDGVVCIDRDPTCFPIILNYLRMGTLIIPESADRRMLMAEAQFYNMSALCEAIQSYPNPDLTRHDVCLVLAKAKKKRRPNFHGMAFTGVNLAKLDLSGCCFDECDMQDCALDQCVLDGASFIGAVLSSCSMRGASTRGTSYRGATLRGADLSSLHCAGSDEVFTSFKEADCENASFIGADLRYASFSGASLVRCAFGGSMLDYAGFEGSDVDNCSFVGASMRRGIRVYGVRHADTAEGMPMLRAARE